MSNNTAFARIFGRRTWAAILVAFVAMLGLPATVSAGRTDPTPVSVADAMNKLSPDLQDALSSRKIDANWIKDGPGGRLVQVVVLSYDTVDTDLQSLRQSILDAGGSIYYRFSSINGLWVMLPASKVVSIAQRTDVERMTPNRPTSRTSSLLESATGAASARSTAGVNGTLDGTGVGIAFLDSGVMASHKAFLDASGASRVKRSVNMLNIDQTVAAAWKTGQDYPKDNAPWSQRRAFIGESLIENGSNPFQDPYGHGTMVASIAAGDAISSQQVDSTGIAPGASIYDVRVLDGNGMGTLTDALIGLDWVLYHAKEYGIRVVNISLAADSSESYVTDPLCRAVRNTVAAGVTVVVAAGNFGKSTGRETYGSISSPGDEPSAITVGAANIHDTAARSDDTLNFFSSRGPTRGGYYDAKGVWQADNLLKPDLIAPGNRLVGALATDNGGTTQNAIVSAYPQLAVINKGNGKGKPGGNGTGTSLMTLSGTSIAAPVVTGTVALMLQANPGLTPPIVKAMLQYTAQPIGAYSLVQQGAGLLDVTGAAALAPVVISDLGTRILNGRLKPGDSIIAAGRKMPSPTSSVQGVATPWSRLVFLGGNRVMSGSALFTKYQPIWDPTTTWVRQRVRSIDVSYWDDGNTYVQGFQELPVTGRNVVLVTGGVVDVTSAFGTSSILKQAGIFTPTQVATASVGTGAGITLSQGIIVSESVVLAEGLIVSEGIIVSEGVIVSEGIIVSEGVIISEGVVVSESGNLHAGGADGAAFTGEP